MKIRGLAWQKSIRTNEPYKFTFFYISVFELVIFENKKQWMENNELKIVEFSSEQAKEFINHVLSKYPGCLYLGSFEKYTIFNHKYLIDFSELDFTRKFENELPELQ